MKARLMMLAWLSTFPAPLRKTRSSGPLGQAIRCLCKVVTTIGNSGTLRSSASDLGRPMALKRSARCRTCSSPRLFEGATSPLNPEPLGE